MTQTAKSAEVRRCVKEILRRDLKLGPDARIDDDMPLFNSEADLDSLDMLLLVASIEREFGFRIPTEAVGQAIFQSVDALAAYIQEHSDGPFKSSVREVQPPNSLLDRLPHGAEFRFVSTVNRLIPGDQVEGVWLVKGTEPFFAGHFPGRPIVPGVLIAEALAQISGLIESHQDNQQGMLAQIDVRFEKPVIPPAQIVLKSQLNVGLGAIRQFQVSAEVEGIIVAHGKIALHLSADAPR